MKRPERDPLPAGTSSSPLLGESLRILVEQSPGIDPVAGERPAAKMMHKKIVSHSQLKPRPPRPLGEIIVIEKPNSKPLVEPADRVINGSLHKQTKAR